MGSAVGREEGVTEAQLLALGDYAESPAFSELEKRVLDLAVALSRTPTEVTDELMAELGKHLDEPQIVELTTSIAWENFRARFNTTFGIKSAGFSEGAFCPLPQPR